MTQDKELLLRDLCARLPYGVKVRVDSKHWCDFNSRIPSKITFDNSYRLLFLGTKLGYVKPYLFPLSSMTEEQKREREAHFTCIKHDMSFSICRYMEWCYKNHLDINGLIPKGFAIDATGLNIY